MDKIRERLRCCEAGGVTNNRVALTTLQAMCTIAANNPSDFKWHLAKKYSTSVPTLEGETFFVLLMRILNKAIFHFRCFVWQSKHPIFSFHFMIKPCESWQDLACNVNTFVGHTAGLHYHQKKSHLAPSTKTEIFFILAQQPLSLLWIRKNIELFKMKMPLISGQKCIP